MSKQWTPWIILLGLIALCWTFMAECEREQARLAAAGEQRQAQELGLARAGAAIVILALIGALCLVAHRQRRAQEAQRTSQPAHADPLETPLLHLAEGVRWTLRDLCSHLLVLGVTGSGKSSGSGRAVAKALLTSPAGIAGGMVLCVKPGEAQTWLRYLKETDSPLKPVILQPGGRHRLNPVAFEVERGGDGGAMAESINRILEESGQVVRRNRSAGSGVEEGAFWAEAGSTLRRHAIAIALGADRTVSIDTIHQIIDAMPTTPAELSEERFVNGVANQKLKRFVENATSERDRHDAKRAFDYLTMFYPRCGDKMRAGIVAHATGALEIMNSGVLWQTMGRDTTVSAEDCEHGVVLLVDASPMTYGAIGVAMLGLAQEHFKRHVLRRHVGPRSKGLFLFCDETQLTLTDSHPDFLATAREFRCGVINITQTYCSFLQAYSGGQAEAKTNALWANYATKCIHSLADSKSGTAAAELIGRHMELLVSVNGQRSPYNALDDFLGSGRRGTSAGVQESYQWKLDPSHFAHLRCGGQANGYLVDGIWIQSGKPFDFLQVTFDQRS